MSDEPKLSRDVINWLPKGGGREAGKLALKGKGSYCWSLIQIMSFLLTWPTDLLCGQCEDSQSFLWRFLMF